MLRSIIFQRIIILLDAAIFGFIIDRLSHSLWWSFLSVVAAGILGLVLLASPSLLATRFKFDMDVVNILRTTTIALVFFIECAVAAWLILA